MSRLRTILFGIIVGILTFFTYRFFFYDNAVKTLEVTKDPKVTNVQRVGINLGKWTPWGAAQYSSNVLFNPGFENGISRAIVVVDRIDSNLVQQIHSPNSYLDQFWNGASFEVLTGDLAGIRGTVKENRKNSNGMEYILDAPISVKPGDSLVLTKVVQEEFPINWWIPDKVRHLVSVDPKSSRPKSPGTQSALLKLTTQEKPILSFYLDMLQKAGKMLPINGTWNLSFWAKASNSTSAIFAELVRNQHPFFGKEIALTEEWKEFSFSFEGTDDGPISPLNLKFTGVGNQGNIWIDDVNLSSGTKGFRKELVEALKKLNPGVIRNWQGQLGDTFQNSIASNFARKPSRYKMAYGDLEYDFFYGLQEFLDLCQEVNALPWIVFSPGFTSDEIAAFAEFLKQHASKKRFSKVFLEYGNEIWNDLYQSGQPKNSYARSNIVFEKIEKLAGPAVKIIPIVSRPADALTKDVKSSAAISPFILTKLDESLSDELVLSELFKPFQKSSQKTVIAETNLHTLGGTASTKERNRIVASAAAGLSLANHLLQAIEDGVQATAVFKLAGFDFMNTNRLRGIFDSEVRLFGVVKDLGCTNNFRPQGLAIQALNKVICGNFHPFLQTDGVTGGAFIDKQKCTFAISSSTHEKSEFFIRIPSGTKILPSKIAILDSKSLFDSNEGRVKVKLKEEKLRIKGSLIEIKLPPYGFAVVY